MEERKLNEKESLELVSNVHFTREGETIYIEDKHE